MEKKENIKKSNWFKKHKIITIVLVLVVLGAVIASSGDKTSKQTVDSQQSSQSTNQAKTPDIELISYRCNDKDTPFNDVLIKVKNNVNKEYTWVSSKFSVYGVMEDGTLDKLTVLDTIPASATVEIGGYSTIHKCTEYKNIELRQ